MKLVLGCLLIAGLAHAQAPPVADIKERPAKLIAYYSMSPFPHLISPDFSYINRFYACLEIEGRTIVATKLWPVNKHEIFTLSILGGPLSGAGGGPMLSAHYDSDHVWVTFARGEKAELKIDHSRTNHFQKPQCSAANQSSN